MQVLIVDDDVMMAQLIAIQLQGLVTPIAVTDGFHDVTTAVDWSQIDAALVDMHLGDGHVGSTLLAWLEEHQPHVKRVLLTADVYIDPTTTHAETVLIKPMSMSAIRSALGIEP